MSPIRLQTYLAHAGVASRRAAEKLITDGRVSVNGATVSVLGTKVNADDAVLLDGIPVVTQTSFLYLLLNKPPEYICSSSDPQGRRLAKDLLPAFIEARLYNVGRLDYRSSGLVIFTNDGDFAAKISHPSSNIEKEYLVEASGHIPDTVIDDFLRGVVIEGVIYQAKKITRIGGKAIRVVLIEGKNREIRRVFSYFHLHPVVLRRIRIGNVSLDGLMEGASRPLSPEEIGGLLRRHSKS
ncbi:MAG: rRNA pseudouridine synthase [Treponema sp.]|jgi:23S rRNA pseudouridine2605 synthase|nr:rRNA pseudouridine synthase [Treponema sp.]